MSSSGPLPEKVSLRLQQETADLDKSCKLVQVCPPTGVQHKRWGWERARSARQWLEEQAEQVLKPMSDLNNTLASMVTALSTLSTSLPEGLKPHIDLAMQELDHQRQLAENGLKTSLDGLRKDIEMIEECPLWK